MRDKKKAIFRYERLSMCFIVLFTALRSPKIQYGGWPKSFLAWILAFSSSIESLKWPTRSSESRW